MTVHIVWDNSNIWLGGRDTRARIEPTVIQYAFRIHFENLYNLVLNTRPPGQRYFGGSVPPEAETLWKFVENLGCETNLLHRVAAGGEQAVDEILHLKMADLLLDIEPPETLALLSGNGHTSQFQSSFPAHVQRALDRGWGVEIYSWECSMSHKGYDGILKNHSQAKYIKLDDFYGEITFIQEGMYYDFIKGKRIDMYQGGRVVKSLKLPVPR